MTSRFHIHASATLFVLAMLYITTTLMRGIGAYQLARIAPILLFLVLILLIAMRKAWLALLLSSWILSFSIPVFLFDTMTIGVLIACLIVAIYMAEKVIKQQAFFSINDVAGALLLIAGSLIIMRLLRDRPGSARVGGVGGLRYAIMYSAAVPFFFVTDKLARENISTNKTLRFVIIVSSLMFLRRAANRLLAGTYGGGPIYFDWYEGPLWILMPIVLSVLLERKRKNRQSLLPVILFCLFWLSLAFLASFRSRIFFALAAISAVFWCYGYKKRLMVVFVASILSAATILPLMPKEHIPLSLRRSLSTFIRFDSRDIRHMADIGLSISTETGWESDFRGSLNRMAFQQMRDNPLTGTGWKFTTAELEWASQFSMSNPAQSALVVSGHYHNSLLTVAVKCGVPAAFLLAVGLLLLLARSVMFVDFIKDGYERIMYAGLLGFLAAVSGQMLMNGEGDDLQAVCIVLGYFHGKSKRQSARSITELDDVQSGKINDT